MKLARLKSAVKAAPLAVAGIALAALGWRIAASRLLAETADWDSVAAVRWGSAFEHVDIERADGSKQPAFFLPAPSGAPQPLVVSLHTWSAGYKQGDPIAKLAKARGWNYVHPDFGGPNDTPDACVSPRAMRDIDAAIQYGIDHGNTDRANLFVVGVSGGGYAALAAYLSTHQPVKAVQAWASITNLQAWYRQSAHRQAAYARNIMDCTGSAGKLDESAARARSPLFMPRAAGSRPLLEIYAGLNDGHDGAVPILHSIEFFNRVVTESGHAESAVSAEDALRLLSRDVDYSAQQIEQRAVILLKEAPGARLVIFDGGHEMLPEYAMQRLGELAASASETKGE